LDGAYNIRLLRTLINRKKYELSIQISYIDPPLATPSPSQQGAFITQGGTDNDDTENENEYINNLNKF